MCLLTLGEMIWKIPYPDFAVFYIESCGSIIFMDRLSDYSNDSEYTLVDSEINES